MEAVAVRSKENVENDQDEVFGILNSLKVVDLIYIYIYIYIFLGHEARGQYYLTMFLYQNLS